MGAVGTRKTPGSGRKRGTPNKRTEDLLDRAKVLGMDPWDILILFANGDWKGLGYPAEFIQKHSQHCTNLEYTIDPSVRAKCAQEACSYIYSKKRTIDGNLKLTHERPLEGLSDDELDDL